MANAFDKINRFVGSRTTLKTVFQSSCWHHQDLKTRQEATDEALDSLVSRL